MSDVREAIEREDEVRRGQSALDDKRSTYRAPHPLLLIALTRMREFYREPEAIFWVYGFPIIMAVALGIAFRNRPQETIHAVVVEGPAASLVAEAIGDSSSPQEGRQSANSESPHSFTPTAPPKGEMGIARPAFHVEIVSMAEARRQLRTGKVAIAIVPRGSATGAPRWSNLDVEYLYDPTRPDAAAARAAVDDVLQRAAGRRQVVPTRETAFSEPGGRYIDFLIPGLLAASLMGGGLWGIGFVTVDLRVRNLLKRFVTTPMKRWHFLSGLILSRFAFMVTEVVVLFVFARLAFGVVVMGSWLLVILLILLGAWTFAGVGLLVACRAKTLEMASGLMNLVLLPMWIFSGIFFSSERFPDFAQPFIKALPLTPLIDALRAVMIDGAGLASVAGDMGLLLAWGVVSFVLALRWFRWY